MVHIVIQSSNGADAAEKATLPFIVGNVAASSEQDVLIFLTGEAVRLVTRGGADGVQHEGFPALATVLADYLKNGGKVWACSSCTKPRGITEADVIAGTQILGAAKLVEFLVQPDVRTLAF